MIRNTVLYVRVTVGRNLFLKTASFPAKLNDTLRQILLIKITTPQIFPEK